MEAAYNNSCPGYVFDAPGFQAMVGPLIAFTAAAVTQVAIMSFGYYYVAAPAMWVTDVIIDVIEKIAVTAIVSTIVIIASLILNSTTVVTPLPLVIAAMALGVAVSVGVSALSSKYRWSLTF